MMDDVRERINGTNRVISNMQDTNSSCFVCFRNKLDAEDWTTVELMMELRNTHSR